MRGANLAQAVNVLQALILTNREKMLLTPSYHIFDLYQVHQNATLILLKLDSPDYVLGNEKTFALNTLASRDKAGVVYLSLVNLKPTQTLSLETSLPGSSWEAITGRILTVITLLTTILLTSRKPCLSRLLPRLKSGAIS